MVLLKTPIEDIPKISRRITPALRHLGIKTVRDLLFYFPSRYEDFSNRKTIREITVGEVVTISGKITKISNRRTARKHMFLTEAGINDGTGSIQALWFNQPFLIRNLQVGNLINLSGKVALGKNGIYLQSPAYEKTTDSSAIHTGGLIAVYPETEGITSRWLRFLIRAFTDLRKDLTDPLPQEILQKYQLPKIQEAIFSIHFPKNLQEAERAKRRFSFEELLLLQLRALKERLALKQHRAPVVPLNLELIKEFVHSLPYELTVAQRRSLWEILQDLSKPHPMNRLLEGDVGSGKTVVAAAASLLTVRAGYGVAFMAPTEILARQHYITLNKLLAPFDIKIGLLTGAEKKADDQTLIVVGTHALIQKGARLKNLGLVVVDEQHRFGVEQRAHLTKGVGLLPHFLSMSATPIPRTLALTIYGDLDLSLLDEMPKSRKEVITKIVEPKRREEAYQFIRQEVRKGRQVFVICPRIEPNTYQGLTLVSLVPRLNLGTKTQQKLLLAEIKAVKAEYEKLSKDVFPDLHVGMLHGKMKAKEKDETMRNFKDGKTDILVSTSVVEVGIDVPNATIMLIEGAEKFGLAQLHQFRGRVGRGESQSYCFLFPSEDGLITQRLRAVAEAKNGFELAEKDLEIRGPGDIFGIRQWGVPDVILKALADAKLVREVRNAAVELLKEDPMSKKYPLLWKNLALFREKTHLE